MLSRRGTETSEGWRWGRGEGEANREGRVWRARDASELPSFSVLHAPPSTCSEGQLTCTQTLPCPGMYPAQSEVRKSSVLGRREGWDREGWLHPRAHIYPHSAWCLVPVVGVDGVLPALLGARLGPAQGLQLPRLHSMAGPRAPGRQGRAGASIRRETCTSPTECPGETPHQAAPIPVGCRTSWASPGKGMLLYFCRRGGWSHQARGDHGLPVTCAWGSPIAARRVAGPHL